MRRILCFVVIAGLIPALAGIGEPDDIRFPDPTPITSPGFPSDLTGKCVTMQGCLEYCKAHPSDPACEGLINKKPNVDK